MKAPSLPVLALAAFPSHQQHLYYIQQLEVHVAQFPHVQEPHAHDFYLLLYVTHGHGTHTIDLITYDLRPGSLFFLMPGQVHSWSLSDDTRGFILFFSEAFYLQQFPASRLAAYPFFNPTNEPVVYSVPAEAGLLPLLERIYQENTAALPAPNSDVVVRGYLFLYLELAARLYPHETPPAPAYAQQHVREFGRLLTQHFHAEKTVGYYAERLSLTANHLNAICRRLLNKTASDLIHERVVTEAQRQLKHSAQSVAQIADALGFEDASYFTRYFKKYAGQTPEAFRQHQNA
ncbi:AraC family transcriptional regulator [Hymenobacter qilianensis]|uniref:Helix-turn-helix domain-containing protein n=2 Tax=Hymenobacter qilianensis TaxID=1385715 RepID=A0A7H0GSU2_9BACT|nr:helix-turn-helix domain-containing protein [Hymenobacter qilianensis]QNP51358.1 helix-turn-helix domain-containing protein [Hymenobacter qilianensis]GGF76045.1 AraC family transcriptional regulator [Hymenobacter qilianensis]